ncbi:peroxiredoxin family protein [Methylobacillus flagellatus]|uniref:peroxiredoxin family protein n=1 Tax=Methylobacillus flagellatus TaxID=405 RepID=UPI0010F8A53E|nr:TlpA disulfide reductase family protein [Methylobacillus flagellatus]
MNAFFLKPRNWLLPLILIGLLAFLGLSLKDKPTAPEVTFTTLNNEQITLQQLRGKVVLVNFWATDCPGCIAEMPQLINTYKQYHEQGFELVAVAMSYDPPSHVLNYTEKNALPFPVMHDGFGEVAKAFGDVKLTPTAFLLDSEGRIIQRVIGELDFTRLHQLLDTHLKKAS